MDASFELIAIPLLILFSVAVTVALGGGALYLIHFLLTAPMRRAERARFILDLVETTLDRGQPVEEALISAGGTRDRSLGKRFTNLTAQLLAGQKLAEALAAVPHLLPPPIVAMFKAGQQIGDLRKVIPACRQLLRDSLSETRSAVNYLVVIAFVVTPMSMFVFAMLCVKVLPVMRNISEGMSAAPSALLMFVWEHGFLILLAQGLLLLALWFVAFVYAAGPRALSWMPFLHAVYFCLPWRRRRMNRDFSIMLAVLLDSRVPEVEALRWAADCTANRVFQGRAAVAASRLQQGMKLTEAIHAMDDAGEFRWRLTNAAHSSTGFLVALAGWHEALDARAFQQEQAAAHGVSTSLVLLNGVIVGIVVVAVFSHLVSILNAGILW